MSDPTKTAAEIRAELAEVEAEYNRLGAELAVVEREQAARDLCDLAAPSPTDPPAAWHGSIPHDTNGDVK